jgi:hypothetical protein
MQIFNLICGLVWNLFSFYLFKQNLIIPGIIAFLISSIILAGEFIKDISDSDIEDEQIEIIEDEQIEIIEDEEELDAMD